MDYFSSVNFNQPIKIIHAIDIIEVWRKHCGKEGHTPFPNWASLLAGIQLTNFVSDRLYHHHTWSTRILFTLAKPYSAHFALILPYEILFRSANSSLSPMANVAYPTFPQTEPAILKVFSFLNKHKNTLKELINVFVFLFVLLLIYLFVFFHDITTHQQFIFEFLQTIIKYVDDLIESNLLVNSSQLSKSFLLNESNNLNMEVRWKGIEPCCFFIFMVQLINNTDFLQFCFQIQSYALIQSINFEIFLLGHRTGQLS